MSEVLDLLTLQREREQLGSRRDAGRARLDPELARIYEETGDPSTRREIDLLVARSEALDQQRRELARRFTVLARREVRCAEREERLALGWAAYQLQVQRLQARFRRSEQRVWFSDLALAVSGAWALYCLDRTGAPHSTLLLGGLLVATALGWLAFRAWDRRLEADDQAEEGDGDALAAGNGSGTGDPGVDRSDLRLGDVDGALGA